jgi:hypothetical protein
MEDLLVVSMFSHSTDPDAYWVEVNDALKHTGK